MPSLACPLNPITSTKAADGGEDRVSTNRAFWDEPSFERWKKANPQQWKEHRHLKRSKSVVAGAKILFAVSSCFTFDYGSQVYGLHVAGTNNRLQAVRETWGKDVAAFDNITLKFFFGRPDGGFLREPLPDEVFLDCPDNYESLTTKTRLICKYTIDEGYDFLFKCDDDTFVNVENLLDEILEKHPAYGGRVHTGICAGGAGYVLNQRCCRIVAAHTKSRSRMDDVHVGLVLRDAMGDPVNLVGHRGMGLLKVSWDDVTAHTDSPEQMREWYRTLCGVDPVPGLCG
jgi:galactosyltransferase